MEKEKDHLTRRQFLKSTAALSTVPIIASCTGEQPLPSKLEAKNGPVETHRTQEGLPTRRLGRTDLMPTALMFGGGMGDLTFEECENLLLKAVELGINYYDTASEYGQSEEMFGHILSPIRDQVYIATKFNFRDIDRASQELESSLSYMKTDYVDVLLVHCLVSNEVDVIESSGIWDWMNDLKSQGVARYIGFSSMFTASSSRDFIERLDPDVCLLAMNPTGYGAFVTEALPAARERNTGVYAMKLLSGLVGVSHTAEELLAWGLAQEGVTAAVVGHRTVDELQQNVDIVKAILGGSSVTYDLAEIERRARPLAGPHALCWARHDYRDDGGRTADRMYA